MISIVPISWALTGLYWLRWIIRKRKDLPVVIPILFTCFFLPKVNLVKVSSLSTAGIRVDDLLALVLLCIAVMDPATYRNKAVKWGTRMLLVLSAVNLLSVLSGRIQGYDNQILLSIMMVIRKFEYGSFMLTGIYAVRRLKNPYKDFMTEFTWMNLLYMLPAVMQVLGKVSFVASGMDRGDYLHGTAASTFNGYYEYGQFLCFGCAVYVCDLLNGRDTVRIRKIPVSLIMLPLTFGMLWASKSRSSLVIGVLLLLIAVYYPSRGIVSRRRLIIGGYGMIAGLVLVTVVATGITGLEIAGRLGDTEMGKFSVWQELLQRGNLNRYRTLLRTGGFEYIAIDRYDYLSKVSDWSLATRLLKWGAGLDGFRMNPLLGYGMGVTHVMDGHYIRLLAETGILGTALWLVFYGGMMRFVWKVRRKTELGRAVLLMMLSILLNAVMIDMFDASRPMEMMWLLAGAVIAFGEGKESSGIWR